MVTVKMAKMCGCAKRNNVKEIQTFDSMEDAMKEAQTLAEDMSETFCKKHNFSVVQNNPDELVVIEVK